MPARQRSGIPPKELYGLALNNALPTGTAVTFSAASGAIDLNGYNQQIASLAGTGADNGIANTNLSGTNATSTLTINGSATTTFPGVIGTPATLTNLPGNLNNIALVLASGNTGTLTLTGASTYTGGTTIDGGTLQVGATNALPKAGAVTLASTSGVLLDLDGNNQTVTELNGGGNGATWAWRRHSGRR